MAILPPDVSQRPGLILGSMDEVLAVRFCIQRAAPGPARVPGSARASFSGRLAANTFWSPGLDSRPLRPAVEAEAARQRDRRSPVWAGRPRSIVALPGRSGDRLRQCAG
jgi:hypothetical protein